MSILHTERAGWYTLQAELAGYQSDGRCPDDQAAMACIEEACSALGEGNFGIGALLVDPDGKTVLRKHNQVFKPYFRSDAHAEMVVVREFETMHHDQSLRGYTLYTS